MVDDPFTLELRLCDDLGIVSHRMVSDQPDDEAAAESYLARHNRLVRMGRPSFDDPKPDIEEPFTCTGSAHLLGQHIRCTSPAHGIDDSTFAGVTRALTSGQPIVLGGGAQIIAPGAVSEWECPHGTKYWGSDDFISGARLAHDEIANHQTAEAPTTTSGGT